MLLSRPARALVVTLFAALLAALVPPSAAHAESRTVQGGRLDWGIKSSFQSYVTGPIAQGSWSLTGGAATVGGSQFRFHSAQGSYDPETGAFEAALLRRRPVHRPPQGGRHRRTGPHHQPPPDPDPGRTGHPLRRHDEQGQGQRPRERSPRRCRSPPRTSAASTCAAAAAPSPSPGSPPPSLRRAPRPSPVLPGRHAARPGLPLRRRPDAEAERAERRALLRRPHREARALEDPGALGEAGPGRRLLPGRGRRLGRPPHLPRVRHRLRRAGEVDPGRRRPGRRRALPLHRRQGHVRPGPEDSSTPPSRAASASPAPTSTSPSAR